MEEDQKLEFAFNLGPESSGDPADNTPFRMLVIGDFGRGTPTDKPIEVDCDNIDTVMRRLQPVVNVPLGESTITITLEGIGDFHPDHLIRNLEVFQPLVRLRQQLQDPSTFEQAAREIRSWPQWKSSESPEPPASPETSSEAEDATSDIERLLGRKPITSQGQAKAIADDIIREIVGPPTTPDIHPERDHLLAAVDDAKGELLRTILHAPQFQAMEAHWRGLDFLVNRLETGVSLKVTILNLSKAVLQEEMKDPARIMESTFYQTVVAQTVETHGAQPWALVALDHNIGLDSEDLTCFQRYLTLARAAKVTVIAAADDSMQKAAEDERWNQLRQQPEAIMGGLLYGQFMLRRPYGKGSDPIDTIPFEEMPDQPDPGHYLWGNPIWILACLLGQAYEEAGWDLRSVLDNTLTGIPTHCFKDGDRVEQQNCTFPTLAESDVAALLGAGLMPVFSMRGQDMVRIAREQSLARTPTPLQGRW